MVYAFYARRVENKRRWIQSDCVRINKKCLTFPVRDKDLASAFLEMRNYQ